MSVQVSNTFKLDSAGAIKVAGSWTTLELSSGTDPDVSGNTGNGFIDVGGTGAYAIRLVYTRGSGTGTMQAYLNAKVF